MKKRYQVAENILEIHSEAENDVWAQVEACYTPFLVENTEVTPAVSIQIHDGLKDVPADATLIFEDIPAAKDTLTLYVYRDGQDNLYFRIIQPMDTKGRVMLKISPDYTQGTVYMEHKGDEPRPWQTTASLTAAIQLCYYFATLADGNLLSHSSCVVKDGKAYLFLGRSGTGKSTHSRMWRTAFPDSILLNDDHPIIRVGNDATATAYGSPWSGKTPCYKNLSAPIGAIVRIKRAKANSIKLLSPIEAFASVMPSMFNSPFLRQLTDIRHHSLEKLICSVPCYELQCLPDVEAAQVCHQGVCKNNN